MRPMALDFVPAAVATAGLVLFAALFATEAASFRRAVVAWAERDLATRTELAADALKEPLATGDFRRIHAFADSCSGDGVRLTIQVGTRGTFFDSVRKGEAAPKCIYASRPCGEYTVRLGLPLERVLAPFRRARLGFLLAALFGGAGVLLVFVAAYRQRVRIRELKRLERFRRDFIADVSHEIKTPLTGIIGAVDLLEAAGDMPKESFKKLLSLVKKESVRLNALAQDVLSLARLERADAAASVVKAPADVAELTVEAVDALRPAAQAAGVKLAVHGMDSPVVLDCDSRLVQQAVSNLVGNAIRHARATQIEVSVSKASGRVRIAVEDDGIGIPAAERGRVFERFYRVDAARSEETGGSGLGLAIVREIAKVHGGDVTLEPAEPSGCRFVLTLL